MATGAQAIETVARAMHLQPPAISRFCRDLREANPTFWPQALKGGGKGAAHVEPPHLVNLALAMAVAAPIAGIPRAVGNYQEIVRGYRALIPHRPKDHIFPDDPDRYGVAAGYLWNARVFTAEQSLGEALERLVELLTNGKAARTLETSGLHIELDTHQMPRAFVRYRTFDTPKDHTVPETELIYRPQNTRVGFLPPRLITQTAFIPVSLFTVLATLIPARQISSPATASASAVPEYENVAALPEAATPRLNQSSTERRRPGRHTSRKLQRSVAVIKEE
jgi:hypothetical protein